MTPEQVALVQASVEHVKPRMAALSHAFYQHLFAEQPALRSLFTTDPAIQERKFADELEAIITAIPDFSAFLTQAGTLGTAHVHYGVRAVHYGQVRQALLTTLDQAMGQHWTEELADAWTCAYDMVAEAMMMGSATLR